ncbi:MAG TPA: hypothetical protein DIV86_01270, partial [Alphaproteobacteria bacterium]|nr:hypothetical protein [Alphaproteobacteria bacterium]
YEHINIPILEDKEDDIIYMLKLISVQFSIAEDIAENLGKALKIFNAHDVQSNQLTKVYSEAIVKSLFALVCKEFNECNMDEINSKVSTLVESFQSAIHAHIPALSAPKMEERQPLPQEERIGIIRKAIREEVKNETGQGTHFEIYLTTFPTDGVWEDFKKYFIEPLGLIKTDQLEYNTENSYIISGVAKNAVDAEKLAKRASPSNMQFIFTESARGKLESNIERLFREYKNAIETASENVTIDLQGQHPSRAITHVAIDVTKVSAGKKIAI